MGYTLRIGEASVNWEEDYVSVDVEGVTLPDAPAFGEPTDNTNSRWPSYTSWSDFSKEIGIYAVMFGDHGGRESFEIGKKRYPALICEHPGVSPVLKVHLEQIEKAVETYRLSHPDHIAQYPPLKEGVEDKKYSTVGRTTLTIHDSTGISVEPSGFCSGLDGRL